MTPEHEAVYLDALRIRDTYGRPGGASGAAAHFVGAEAHWMHDSRASETRPVWRACRRELAARRIIAYAAHGDTHRAALLGFTDEEQRAIDDERTALERQRG